MGRVRGGRGWWQPPFSWDSRTRARLSQPSRLLQHPRNTTTPTPVHPMPHRVARFWATYHGTPKEFADRALVAVGRTFPPDQPQFKADFVAEATRLAAAKIPGGNLRGCVGVAIASV